MNDLNSGFDASAISYFNEIQFEIVLARVKELKAIGIYGIEAWKDGEFWAVDTFESYKTYPQDSHWYETAFKKFRNGDETFHYSASFYVPGNYLEYEDEV